VFFVIHHASRQVLHVHVTPHPTSRMGGTADRRMLRLGPRATPRSRS
jgi:hypothetical protein